MAHSFKVLKANFNKYSSVAYTWFLRFLYWGSVPTIILYGLFSKPYSPMVLYFWNMITGQEDNSQDYYGGNPYGQP